MAYPAKPSGNGPLAAASNVRCTRGEIHLPSWLQITLSVGRTGQSQWDFIRQTLTASIMWATTYMSGVLIGTMPATTTSLPSEIRVDPATGVAVPREVAPGGTTSRSAELRRAQVFRQRSNIPTTASESLAP